MDCVLNRPTCKRTIMESKGQFQKETCPVLEKPKCMFAQKQCPLLPEENGCTLAKVMDIIKKGGCFAKQPPPPKPPQCCCCCTQQPEPENPIARCRVDRTVEMPPCTKCKKGINAPMKDKQVPLSKSPSSKKKRKQTSSKSNNDQKIGRVNKYVPECTLNSRRPFPCADCLMELLHCPLRSVDYDNSKVYCKARAVKCPFTQIIDTCDSTCLCSNVPAIDTGPKCPFLPEPCPCVAPSCPLSRIPPNPLVERVIPPVCPKPYCRCFCPIIPNPCSFTCPECPVHSGKVKCPLEQGNICPSLFAPMPQVCLCVPADPKKTQNGSANGTNQNPDENLTSASVSKNIKTLSNDVNRDVEMDKTGVESTNDRKASKKDLTVKLNTKPSAQVNYGKDQENSTVLLKENNEPIPSPNQENYQKTSRYRKHPFHQFTQSRSDQFPYFVDTKRGDLRTDFETKSEHASLMEINGALEGIEDYYDGNHDRLNPTTSELYSAKSQKSVREPCGCPCWSEYKKRRKLTNYPSIRTESLYKSAERKLNIFPESRTMNKRRLAKMLPPASMYIGMNTINKMDAPKMCRAPLGNFNCHEPSTKNTNTTANISERDREIADQFANRISAKIESPEFRFIDEFNVCECGVPKMLTVRQKECPCEEATTVQSCGCGVDYEFPQCGCPCGPCCPSKISSPPVQRTFHVPTCPQARPLPQPKSPEKDDQLCPFSPNACPLGPYCLFPVTSKYDPKSPKIPKTDKVCFCQDQDCMRPPPTIESPCPLEKINHNKCVCAGKPSTCSPCCPLAQPESLPPIFRRCPFICPQNSDCMPPPIARLCKCCAQSENCDRRENESLPTEGMICFCGGETPRQRNTNKMPSKSYGNNNALSIGTPYDRTERLGDMQNGYKVPEVAYLPESLTKLLNEGKSEKRGILNDMNSSCLCAGGISYEKANYENYKTENQSGCRCCPCANKSTIKCPLNLENCSCLNLTQTNACPLNALQCPVERPICPVMPKLTPEKPKELLNVKGKDSSNNGTINNVLPRSAEENESDLTKKFEKSEQSLEKKPTSDLKSIHLGITPNRASVNRKLNEVGNSSQVKFRNTRKHYQPSRKQKLLGGPPKCMLEKNKCPLTGIKPAVFPGGDNSVANNIDDFGCPIKNSPCELFPEGRCPMMEVGACNCNYPVAPCMAPAQCGYVNAPPQYCYKEDCCMGLTLPPIYPAAHGKYDTGFYYQFMDWKPGEKTTKHYIEVSTEPPPMDFFHGHENRQHDNWWILREGKGYEQCKKVKEIIDKRGPVEHMGTQFNKKDNPLDIETQTIMENRKNREEKMNTLQQVQPSWKD